MYARVKATGERIRGTHDSLLATAQILDGTWEIGADGTFDFTWEGTTDLSWDSQKTLTENGQRLYVTEGWNVVMESEIELVEEDES